ncbi:MAG: glycosyltransferase family 1 protein [Ginsengibacter sp.]
MSTIKYLNYGTLKADPTHLICFSHLRWNFVYQRPQHLLARFAKKYKVFYVEEPVFNDDKSFLQFSTPAENVLVITPNLKATEDSSTAQNILLADLFQSHNIKNYIFWYYTPMALTISDHFKPDLVVYDCMDELSNFKFAPPELKTLEEELFNKADIVFTGGHNLYQAKKNCHDNIYAFPSSIDKEHFLKARKKINDPGDQDTIGYPRFGFYGVVDERFDIELLREVSSRKPEWQFVIIGPVVKIDPATLPASDNIHYLGNKSYDELPAYLANWSVALIPFMLNDSTLYISPTKTPEYLAAGKPVISSSIKDVVSPYGINGLVHIADDADTFIQKAEMELASKNSRVWLKKVDEFLADISWDKTWARMNGLIESTANEKAVKDSKVRDLNATQKVAYV